MSLPLPVDRPLRLLITRADRIGDLVLSTPIFEAVRQKYPEAWIACLAFQENRELIEGQPFLNEVILYDKSGRERSVIGQWSLARRLAKKQFDVVVHLHSTHRMHLLTWLADVPVRIGWRRKCAWALTYSLKDGKKEGLKHEASYNFDLLAPLNIAVPQILRARVPLSEKCTQSLEELCRQLELEAQRPWVVLSPSASCPSKVWPPERFGELADKIAAAYPVDILVIGAPPDRPLIERLCRRTKTKVYDLGGRLTLGMLSVLLSRAALLVSNDSGPVHVANAVGTPAISIFGRRQAGLSAKRWGPLDPRSRVVWKDAGCDPCLAHRCEIHFICLDRISSEDVFREVRHFEESLLAGKPSWPR